MLIFKAGKVLALWPRAFGTSSHPLPSSFHLPDLKIYNTLAKRLETADCRRQIGCRDMIMLVLLGRGRTSRSSFTSDQISLSITHRFSAALVANMVKLFSLSQSTLPGEEMCFLCGRAVTVVSCMRHLCFQPFVAVAASSKRRCTLVRSYFLWPWCKSKDFHHCRFCFRRA